jgi:hypothetical protein
MPSMVVALGTTLAISKSMKIRIASRHKLLLCMATCVATLALSHNASALPLGIGDSHELGFVSTAQPSQNKATYVNHLIGMALGSIDIVNGATYFRSTHAFGSLPTVTWALQGTGTTINLGVGGVYSYLFASYKGSGAEVWYVGNLTGIITIPAIAGVGRLVGWTLFAPGCVTVPDGGITAMLLGLAVCGLGVFRRFATG